MSQASSSRSSSSSDSCCLRGGGTAGADGMTPTSGGPVLSGEGPHPPHQPRGLEARAAGSSLWWHTPAAFPSLPGAGKLAQARLQLGSLQVFPLSEMLPPAPRTLQVWPCRPARPPSSCSPGAPSPAAIDPAHSRLVRSEPCCGVIRLCPSLRPATDAEGQGETLRAPC